MPCPKCNHLLITEDGVTYCEECLHVTARKDDSRYDLISEITQEIEVKSESKSKPKLPTRKRGRPKKRGRKKLCSTEECKGVVYAKGVCKKCYTRRWIKTKKKKKHIFLNHLINDGHDIYKIYLEAGGMQKAADKIGVASNTLLVWLKSKDLPLVYGKGRKILSVNTQEKIKDLRLQGYTIETICERLGISHTTVKRYQPESMRGIYGNT